jgi:hypothetical protein
MVATSARIAPASWHMPRAMAALIFVNGTICSCGCTGV